MTFEIRFWKHIFTITNFPIFNECLKKATQYRWFWETLNSFRLSRYSPLFPESSRGKITASFFPNLEHWINLGWPALVFSHEANPSEVISHKGRECRLGEKQRAPHHAPGWKVLIEVAPSRPPSPPSLHLLFLWVRMAALRWATRVPFAAIDFPLAGADT